MAKAKPSGYVKIYRELLEKPIWENSTPEQKVILVTLLMMANFGEKQWEWRGKKFRAKPGQFVTSLDSIAKAAGASISVKNVRTALKRFEKLDFLANESTKTGRLITIINWDVYQGVDAKVAKQPAKSGQRGGKDRAPREECKNVRKKEKTIYRRVQHLELTEDEYQKLATKYTKSEIDDVLDQMENYVGLKKYKSAYLTASNWLKRRDRDKRPPNRKNHAPNTRAPVNYDDLVCNLD
jgi:DNA replication protein DnaD